MAQFYEQSIDNLLRRWNFRESGGLSANRFTAEDKFRFLRYFARESLKNATAAGRDFEEFDYPALTDFCAGLAKEGKLSIGAENAEDLVREIHKQAGLLNALRDPGDDRKDGLFVFSHRSLHEYCAAAGFLKQGDAGLEEVSAQLGNPAWRQTIFFYCAMEHDNALRLVEIIHRQALAGNRPELLALAGHGAAVMAEPHPRLRLNILDDLSHALGIADDTQRPHLLKSLLALGNSPGQAIKARLEQALRDFIEVAGANQIIQEIGRMEPGPALEFLRFLAASHDSERKIQALHGLRQMDGIGKIPLLWRVLLDLQVLGLAEAGYALWQLLRAMAEPGAVERLNHCEPPPPSNLEPTSDEVQAVYPFPEPGETVSNLARLLAWARQAGVEPAFFRPADNENPDQEAWRRFLIIVLAAKSDGEQQEWKRLSRDRDRWTPKIETLRLGRILWGVPLGLGGVLMWIWFSHSMMDANRKLSKILFDSDFLALCLILIYIDVLTVLFWLSWRGLLTQLHLLGQLQAFPAAISHRLIRSSPPTGWVRRIIHWTGRAIYLLGAFIPIITLLALSSFILHSSIHGHTEQVYALATSSSTKNSLLTGSQDHTARLWDTATGKELRRFKHDSDVNSVAYAPDGKTVLTGSDDKTARLWDAATGKELRGFKNDGLVFAVAYAPDGKTVLTGSADKTARRWDAATGNELRRFKNHGLVLEVAYAPDGMTILTGSDDNTARLWDAATGNEPRRLKQDNWVLAVAYAPDGQTVYIANKNSVNVYATKTGEFLWELTTPFWSNENLFNWNVLYLWLALTFISFFVPALKWFDPGNVIYLRKPNRYLHLYQIPHVERWLPPENP